MSSSYKDKGLPHTATSPPLANQTESEGLLTLCESYSYCKTPSKFYSPQGYLIHGKS